MTSSIYSLFILCTVLSITQIFALKAHSRCLIGKDGKEICEPLPFQPVLPVRMQLPCSKNDMNCWNVRAVGLTNDIRRRNGKSKRLNVGPVMQLENALRHSKVMSGRGRLDHQKLKDVTRQIGCKLFANAENIAYTSQGGGDIAKTCVDMWETSPGHLGNILLDNSENVVVGFYIDGRGFLWCTQTFSLSSQLETFGNPNDPGCSPAGTSTSTSTSTGGSSAPTTTTNSGSQSNSGGSNENQEIVTTTGIRNEGNRACRCLEFGSRCWASLREASGGRCMPFVRASRQPSACRQACCNYCTEFRTAPSCKSRNVRSICRIPLYTFF